MKILSGTSNLKLSKDISKNLKLKHDDYGRNISIIMIN